MKPLLIVDGDSFAHRYYHALPKSIRRADGGGGNLLDGVGGLLIRLWEEEAPRAVLAAWDTLTVPTYRHTALPAYQSGREFDKELLDQLDLMPQLVEAMGFAPAKEAGYEADDFLAAGVAFEEARGGSALVASGDRDTFQLASERTTILQPQMGGGALARIGPAEVRERYGVDPGQVPDFIALRGDPSDKIPGARGVGAKTAASLLAQYGNLESALAEGRFAAEADALRLYRHVATMDKDAPLPALDDQEPTWDRAAALADEWGLGRLAGRLEAAVELLTNPALAHLHPTGEHPERQERLLGLGGETVERRATDEQLSRVHTPDHLAFLQAIEQPLLFDSDTVATETSWEAAVLAAGVALEAVDRGGFALVRPPGHHALADRAMGFCMLNNVAVAARYAQAELGLERIAIVDYDVHHGNGTEAIFRGDDSVLFVSLHQWPFYPGTGGPGTSDETTLNLPLPAGCGDAEYRAAFAEHVEPAVREFAPDLLLVSAGFDAHAEDPLGEMELSEAAFRELSQRCAALAPRIAAVLEGGYNLATLPGLVAAAHEGFSS